jgi:hypothetical protein
MRAPATTIDRVARGVAIAASIWFAFAASWGMFGIPGGGHTDAGGAGNVMAGEQMIKWKILYGAWGWFTGVKPPETDYLCHHPFGQNYVPALLYLIFGHKDFLVHLPATLMSIAMPPLLYGIGKERWGRPTGAIAAAGYVFVPIAVGFSNFWNLETISIFGALLFFWGHSRHVTTGRARHFAASLAGLVVTCSGDWAGYLLVAPTLGWAFARAFVLPARWTPRVKIVPYAKWWALSLGVLLGTLLWWLWLFKHVGQINEWLNAGTSRQGGSTLDSLRATLDARKAWIDFSFTPVAIAVGKVAAPVCLLRLLVNRTDEETYAPGLLFGAAVQYVVFKQGADVHIFWPHYFAPYFALALAALANTIGGIVAWIVRRFSRPRAASVGAVVCLVTGLLPALAMAHDGVRSLWVWRRTGGRYDDNGAVVRSQIDQLFVLRHAVMPFIKLGTRIDVHPLSGWGWEQTWTYQGECNVAGAPSLKAPNLAAHPFWMARASQMSADEQRRVAASAHVRIYGDVWIVDQREAPAPLDAYSLNEREPNPIEWLLLGGTEPVRSIGSMPDPWLTWEWRTHLDQPAIPPQGEPKTLDEVRIAHNAAIAAGDEAVAAKWRARIQAELDRGTATEFTSGVRLLGTQVTRGVQPKVVSWFQVANPVGDLGFSVRSRIEARDPFSTIGPSATDREMADPPSLATKLWRPRFLYTTFAVANHRIGRERYWGSWGSRDGSPAPRRADGKPETTLATIP